MLRKIPQQGDPHIYCVLCNEAVDDDGARVTYVLLNGSRCDLTFCAGCMDQADGRMLEVWANVVETEWHNERDLETRGIRKLTPEREAYLSEFSKQAPVGILSITSRKDLQDG